jgi:hypothetical protein
MQENLSWLLGNEGSELSADIGMAVKADSIS